MTKRPSLSRRRFIAITASAAGAGLVGGPVATAGAPYRWRGIALGAAARTGAKAGDGPPSPSDGVPADAVSALVNLGYSRSESFGAVAHAVQRLGGEATLEALVREGLVELGR